MKHIKMIIKNSLIFAFCQGFQERAQYVDGYGRSHDTNMDWNEAYGHGANAADWLQGGWRDSLTFAYWQGFYERSRYVDGFGRSHATNDDWSDAYNRGANLSDQLLRRC